MKPLIERLAIVGGGCSGFQYGFTFEGEPAEDWWIPFVDRLEHSHPDDLAVFDWKETDPWQILKRLAAAAKSAGIPLKAVGEDDQRPHVVFRKTRYTWRGRSKKHDAFVAGLNSIIESQGVFYGVADLDGESADAYGYYVFTKPQLAKVKKKLGRDFSTVFRAIKKQDYFKS